MVTTRPVWRVLIPRKNASRISSDTSSAPPLKPRQTLRQKTLLPAARDAQPNRTPSGVGLLFQDRLSLVRPKPAYTLSGLHKQNYVTWQSG
jgi:hypothetical protein